MAKTYKYYQKVRETYVFDIKNSKCHWRKTHNGRVLADEDIGYLTDFEKLMDKTAL